MKKPDINILREELENTKDVILGHYPILDKSTDPISTMETFLESLKDQDYYIKYIIHLRSYILLSHASLEEFIESCAKYLIYYSYNNYLNKKIIDERISWLMLYGDKNDFKENENLNKVIDILKEKYNEKVNKNHGIKSSNLKNMFAPIAIDKEQFNLELYDQLGDIRGIFAHYGGLYAQNEVKRIKNVENLEDYIKFVENVLNDLELNLYDNEIKILL